MRASIITNQKHPIIVALNKKGYYDIELYYGSKGSTSWGWEVMGELNLWLGFTIADSIRTIKNLNTILLK